MKLATALVALGLALGLAACSSDAAPSPSTRDREPPGAASDPATSHVPPAPSGTSPPPSPPASKDGGAIPSEAGVDDAAQHVDTPASCVLELPPGAPFGACGGRGGGTFTGAGEVEPNDTSPEALENGVPVCGSVDSSDVDRFRLAVGAGDCVEIVFRATTASVHVVGPGVDQSQSGSAVFDIEIPDDGALDVVVTGTTAEAYVLAVR